VWTPILRTCPAALLCFPCARATPRAAGTGECIHIATSLMCWCNVPSEGQAYESAQWTQHFNCTRQSPVVTPRFSTHTAAVNGAEHDAEDGLTRKLSRCLLVLCACSVSALQCVARHASV